MQIKKSSPYLILGIVGVLFALAYCFLMVLYLDLPFKVVVILFMSSASSFIVIAYLIKVLTGINDHVMLRNFTFCLIINYLVLKWFGAPELVGLDLFAVGYGILIMIGRIGCFRVGCCHGKPSRWGITNRKPALPQYYRSSKIFPLQLAESVGLFFVVAYCTSLLISSEYVEGQVLITYVVLYGLLRFVLEYFRGDLGRRFLFSVSEAQWTIVLLLAFFWLFSIQYNWPFSLWQKVISIFLFSFLLLTIILFHSMKRMRFYHVLHLKELLSLFKPNLSSSEIVVQTTSLGISVSSDKQSQDYYYCISSDLIKLNETMIEKVAKLVQTAHFPASSFRVVNRNGVFHLFFELANSSNE